MALMKFKRSAVPAKVPSIVDLALGELAINTYDGKLFLKKNDGTESIVEIGAGGGGGSGTVTSVSGTGSVSGLTLSGTVTSTGSLTLGGTLALTSGDITGGLGFTPATAAQGAKADTAVQSIASTDGSVTITGTTAIDLSVAVAGATSNVLLPVRNTTGATLTKGTAVYISGATGQLSTVSKAIATSDATSAQTLGLVTANIANNSNGNVTLIGTITNINTSAYTDGQQLYLSPTTAGTLTATKPHAPDHLVYMAVVEHAHPSQGKLFVKVQNGYEMDELHDVSAQSPANNDGLFYNTSTSLWEKKSIATALGFTPYNATNPAGYITGITSGNVTTALGYTPYNASNPSGYLSTVSLTANVTGTLPVGNGGTGATSLTSGYLVKGNGTSAVSASVVHDNGTNVGIGTSSPISATQAGCVTAAGIVAAKGYLNAHQTSAGIFEFNANVTRIRSYGATASTGLIAFNTGGGGGSTDAEAMRIDTSGNVGIGTASPAARLHLESSGAATGFRITNSGTLYVDSYANASGYVINSVQNAPITFGTSNSERMRITGGGLVGVNTTTPSTNFEVNGGLIAGSENRQTHPPTGPVGFKAQWNFTGGDGETDFYNLYSPATTSFRFYQTTGSGTAQLLYNMRPSSHEFYTGGTERFRINSTGGITSSDLSDAVGYKGLPQNQRTGAYTLALSDIGKHLYVTAGAFAVTLPADATLNFPVGSAITFVCEDAGKTIVPASGVALVLAGTGAATTGTRTLAIGAVATLIKVQANRWYISGSGVT